MGLDSLISRSPDEVVLTPDDKRVLVESGVELCGGMYSDGICSFRGKVYAEFVLEVTGESLYQPWLTPETVALMAEALAPVDPEEAADFIDLDERWVPSPGEIRDLQTLFRICSERGLGIIAWA